MKNFREWIDSYKLTFTKENAKKRWTDYVRYLGKRAAIDAEKRGVRLIARRYESELTLRNALSTLSSSLLSNEEDSASSSSDEETPDIPSQPVPGASQDIISALDSLAGFYTTTPLTNHLATSPMAWNELSRGEWNAPSRGWFETGQGDTRRRIVLLGESHDRMEYFLEHVFENKATRIWEKNLHVREVIKARTDYAKWYALLSESQQQFLDKRIEALQRDESEGDILNVDSDEITQEVTNALRFAISSEKSEVLGRLIGGDTEIYDSIDAWIRKKEPKELEHLAPERRRWRFASVLVGAQHFRGLKHYITTLGGFSEVRASPSLFAQSLNK
jgi:hypothetical protein